MTTLHLSSANDGMLPPGLSEAIGRIDERVTAGSRGMRRNGGGQQELTWRSIAAIITLLAMAFAAGENWHRIDALTDVVNAQHEQNEKDHEAFANKDLVQEQNKDMRRELTTMANDLKTLLAGQRAAKR